MDLSEGVETFISARDHICNGFSHHWLWRKMEAYKFVPDFFGFTKMCLESQPFVKLIFEKSLAIGNSVQIGAD
jgi:hypothetical protein